MWQYLVTNIHENWKLETQSSFHHSLLFNVSVRNVRIFSFHFFLLFWKPILCHFLHPVLFVVCPEWVSLSYVHCIFHYCAPWLMCCLLLLSFSRLPFFHFYSIWKSFESGVCETGERSRWIRQVHKANFMLSFVYNLLQDNYVLFDSNNLTPAVSHLHDMNCV